MKLRISSSIFLLALTTTAFASAPMESASGKVYAGLFGGWGSSNNFNVSQYGTAYFIEADGGPLAVNAFGQANSQSAPFYGVQLGYQAPAISINPCSPWTLGPAAELEGYSMSNRSFSADLVNNTDRLAAHNFTVTYPMSRTVFLANAVLNFNNPSIFVHPYVGFGIGGALLRVSGADSTQTTPAEAVNHYNANPNDNTSTFAGQFKLGLSYDINKYVSVFADYRYLYLASTQFTFGSTIAPGHAATSSWQVNMDAQTYNLGNVGVRFSV